jgi:aspartate aminotransferase
MPEADRKALRAAALTSHIGGGWSLPAAPFQYAVGDLETIGIDIRALQHKRNRLHAAPTQWGYAMPLPQGAFYLWGRAPGWNFLTFNRQLAQQGVFMMPGTLFDLPAHFRVSLTATATATAEMI